MIQQILDKKRFPKKGRIINKNVLHNKSTDLLAVHFLCNKKTLLIFLYDCKIIKTPSLCAGANAP